MGLGSQILCFFIMALLSNAKVLISGKAKIGTLLSALRFNIIVFAVITALFSVFRVGGFEASRLTVLSALAFSVGTVIYQTFYVLALEKGPISLLVLINNFSVVPNAVFGTLLFAEDFRIAQIIGLILILASLILTMEKSGGKKSGNSGYLLITIAMLAGSAATLVQRYHQKTEFAAQRNQFLFFAYLFSFIITLIIVLCLRARSKNAVPKEDKKFKLSAGIVGIVLSFYQFLLIFLSGVSTSMIMYPMISGLGLVINFIMCAVIFKEKITLRQKIGAALGTAAIVIMAF